MEIFRPYKFDKTLFLATLTLIAFGVIMIFSASAIRAVDKFNQPFYYYFNQLIVAAFGLGLIFIMLSIKKPFYQNPAFIYGLLLLSFFLLALCLIMPAIENTNRWVQLLGLRFQPSELAKISLVFFLAHYLNLKKEKLNSFLTLLFPLAVLLIFIFLIIKEPDFGTAILIFIIASVMFFISGVKVRHLLILGLTSACLFGFFLFQATYRLDRIMAFLSPEKYPLSKGFQIIQSNLAIGSGGLLGVSIGESTQKLYYLPCAHTDYIFAIIGEELGLVGTTVILTLFLIFLLRGVAISWKAPNNFSQLIAAGLTMAVVSQALLNISIVLGLGPPSGFPLPLISFGRSSLICTLFATGILLNISQRRGNNRKKE